jgi:hypothetical protein
MSDFMGSSNTITPDWSNYITQGGQLYNQALGEVHPSSAVIDQAAQMQNQMGNQNFNTGLSGSTIANQALASGQTQAFDKDAMAQAQQILGMGTKVGATDIGSQIAQSKKSEMDSPFNILSGLFGSFAGLGGIPGIEALF